ncbi:MAG: DDE-type integrase/transposase/recombinase [Nitrosopumilales archaeon]|jgi:transposase InsO family protein|nr:DDE-type integrase/transposase/recombinase [Nitrosopumilales archaeon]
MDIIENRYRMIIEPERSGKTVSDVCIAFGVSRETWYKWKRRYDTSGLDGLKNQSRRPHNIKYVKVTGELEKIILELRLNSRFGPRRIKFRLKRKYGVSLGTKTIYNLLKKHKLNVLSVKLKRKYKRFEMKHPNELVQMDTKGPFYLKASRSKHYFIHAIDDCSRKVVSKWCNRRSSEEALSVLKEWVELHNKPMKVMHDGGKEFTSNKFKNFLILNGIKDKQIPKGYPQEQGKVEAYNKIIIAEFLQVEELIDEKDGAEKYESFVNSYNYEREHGGINGMTPVEKFIKCLKQPIMIH